MLTYCHCRCKALCFVLSVIWWNNLVAIKIKDTVGKKKLKCIKDKVCHFLTNITDLHSIEWDSQTLECWDCAIWTWNHICSFEKISSLVLANKRMYMYMQYVSLQAYLDTMKMLSTFKTSFKVGLLSKADKVTDIGNFCPVIL